MKSSTLPASRVSRSNDYSWHGNSFDAGLHLVTKIERKGGALLAAVPAFTIQGQPKWLLPESGINRVCATMCFRFKTLYSRRRRH